MKVVFKSIVVAILTFEAAILLKRKKPKVIAVTGSVGKTSTKDAIFAAIKNDLSARKSEKSFNSDIGVPLTILGLPNAWSNPLGWLVNIADGAFTACFARSYPDVLVLETGIDRPGDMKKLTKWLKPDIAVVTRLPDIPVHVEYFSSPEAVVEEKMKLVSALKPDGVFVYNADDTVIQAQLPEVLQQCTSYARYLEADIKVSNDRIVYADDQPVGIEFIVAAHDKIETVQLTGTVGTQHAYGCAAAIAVAHTLGVSIENAATALQSLRSPNGRLRIVPGIKGSCLIDDTYNSSPIAAEHALETLSEIKYAKRKIVVMGDMLELGKYSAEQHKRIGAEIAKTADMLLTVGVRARGCAEGALSAGMKEAAILQYDETERAGRELQNLIQPGDVILIKASQSIRAERIVEEVMQNPDEAALLLTRQDPTWKKIT